MMEPFDIAPFLQCDAAERVARIRSLRTCIRLLAGSTPLPGILDALEREPSRAMELRIGREFDDLPSRVQRNILASWAASWR